MDIADRVFLVTGAGSGLGYAVSSMITENGGKVLLLDVNEERGQSSAESLGSDAHFFRTDVTTDLDGQAAISQAKLVFGGVDGLVNCAGVAPGEKILGKNGPHELANFARAVSINLVGTFNMLRLAAEAMAERPGDEGGERGIVINTASIAAFDGQIGQAAYAASKGGVASMTLPAARELARFGIRVVTIAPGIFKTQMMSSMPKDVQERLGASVPFPAGLGEPAEYASLVRHIIQNRMLNGEVIRLDGALRMAPK